MSYEFEHKDLFENVVGVVEASRYESLSLWRDYKVHRPGKKWEQSLSGPLVTVGELDGRPVCISVFVHTIGGHRVVFMEPTSQVVDHKMIEEWLLEHLPDSAMRQNTWGDGKRYINKVDAMNFFNVFPNE